MPSSMNPAPECSYEKCRRTTRHGSGRCVDHRSMPGGLTMQQRADRAHEQLAALGRSAALSSPKLTSAAPAFTPRRNVPAHEFDAANERLSSMAREVSEDAAYEGMEVGDEVAVDLFVSMTYDGEFAPDTLAEVARGQFGYLPSGVTDARVRAAWKHYQGQYS